jgi:ornithine decarboxylase
MPQLQVKLAFSSAKLGKNRSARMGIGKFIWTNPAEHLRQQTPDHPVSYFAPHILKTTFAKFQAGFPGLVTYAVKANTETVVIENLAAAGLTTFDVASPAEIKLVRAACPTATLHYNNPVRSVAEIEFAKAQNVVSYSIDNFTELAKLAAIHAPKGIEIAVRLKLPIKGAAYDFGAKFGATPDKCAALLQEVARLGFTPSMTFHPGTQCKDPSAWATYISATAEISQKSGVLLHRLNVGGGFPSHRSGARPDLAPIFRTIAQTTKSAFPRTQPHLICEPGRAMVAEAFTLATRIKAINDEGAVFLNDGTYGALAELPDIEENTRLTILTARGEPVIGPTAPRHVFGPTCDSIDVLPGEIILPAAIADGDYLLFQGMGAYSHAVATGFNGYGQVETVTVLEH